MFVIRFVAITYQIEKEKLELKSPELEASFFLYGFRSEFRKYAERMNPKESFTAI